MASSPSNESHPGNVSHSHGAGGRELGDGQNGTSHDRELELVENELKTAVSVATAQFGQALHAVGNELLSIDTRHRAVMERLQRIAEKADERALHQFEALQEEAKGARGQIVSVQESLEAVRGSFSEQLKMIGSQCEGFNQQLQTAEQRFNGIEQQLQGAEHRIQTAEDQDCAVQQRVQAAEQRMLEAERNWQRMDEWVQSAEQRFKETEQQLHIAEQRMQTADDKHDSKHDAMGQRLREKILEAEQNWQGTDERVQSAEQRFKETEQQLHIAEQRMQTADNKHDAMEKIFQAADKKILETEQKLTDADRQIKGLGAQIKSMERTTAQFAETKRMFDEQAQRRENVEVAIGALSQDIDQVKAQFSDLLTGPHERLKSLHAMLKSNRRLLRLAVAAFFLILLVDCYLRLGKPGWPILAPYLSRWVPGLPI